jgi:tight adherence protein B
VAGVGVVAYGGLGVRAALRRQTHGRAARRRRHDLDQLAALAADLRAGLPVPAVDRWAGSDRLTVLADAAVHLADRTGAPLAELLERIEADARAADRGLAAAQAQAAGARATAWLLAALPLGGIGLGYAIGADPVAVLLHTPVGGVSAVVAMALQAAGLRWAERLGAAPGQVG